MKTTIGKLRSVIQEALDDYKGYDKTVPVPEVGSDIAFTFEPNHGGSTWKGQVVNSSPGGQAFIAGRLTNTHPRVSVKFSPDQTGRSKDMIVNFVLNGSVWAATGKEQNWMYGKLSPVGINSPTNT